MKLQINKLKSTMSILVRRIFASRKDFFRMILSGIIFFAVALPFRKLLSLVPNMTEIRPANAIPPLLGIVWGIPAVLGISMGNLISDIASGSGLFICITGFLANFLFAYLPYKMWYSFKVIEDDIRPTLGSVKKIVKYIFIIFLDSLAITAILSFIFESAGFTSSAESYLLLFFNNFDFAVLLGVPLIMLFEKLKLEFNVPKPSRKRKKNKKTVKTDLKKQKLTMLLEKSPFFAVVLVSFIGFLYFVISGLTGKPIRPIASMVLLFFSLSACATYLFLPYSFEQKEQKNIKANIKASLKTKLFAGFLLISVVFIVFTGFTAFNASSGITDKLTHWMLVYQTVGVAVNIIFAIALLFLWYVERRIVAPLETLSETATEFANTDHNKGIQPEYADIRTGDEIEKLSGAFNQMMTDITDYVTNLKKVTAEKERIGAELNVATKIQASMLPCIFPAFPERKEFDIYAKMTPAKEVGGDFYDFFLIDENRLCIIIADVSGKGIPAALFMVIAKTLLKNSAQNGNPPALIFKSVNNQLCEGNDTGMFVTAFAGILDLNTGRFIYVNAGHNPPLIKKQGGEFEWLASKPDFVLAGMEDIRFNQNETYLTEGDTLFLYTDGVTEASNKRLELFSNQRLEDCLNNCPSNEPSGIISYVQEEIDIFANGAEQADDITMLILKIKALGISDGFKELTLPASVDNLERVLLFTGSGYYTDTKTRIQIETAVEELFVNIASYAYAPMQGNVCIRTKTEDSVLTIEFEDEGEKFNPLERSDPDITLTAGERSIGGMGIYMVKKMMDKVSYKYENKRNVLTIQKRI